jgi:hypothetical protein
MMVFAVGRTFLLVMAAECQVFRLPNNPTAVFTFKLPDLNAYSVNWVNLIKAGQINRI